MEWQDFVGPVLVYRPQIEGQSVQHFNGMDFDIVWKFTQKKRYLLNYCLNSLVREQIISSSNTKVVIH